jgi:GTP-binding protein
LTKTDEIKKGTEGEVLAAVVAVARTHTAAFPELFATSAHAGSGLEALKLQLASLAGR